MPSSPNPGERRDLDSAARILRQRVTPESRFYALVDVAPDRDPNSAAGSFDRALPFTARLSRVTEAGQPQIGDMPPQPPTWRGRVGAVLVNIVRRMLFWYTGQIRALQQRIAEAAREQARAFQELSAAERRQQTALAEVTQRLAEQEQKLQQAGGRLESIERQARALAAQADEMRRQVALAAAQHPDDHLLADHARAFRGAPDEIKRRLAVYLPYVQKAYAAAGNAPALDLGCGRGEWLEVLRETGIPASGIDWNRDFVNACRDLGLHAIEGNLPHVLRSLPAASCSIVTAIHVLEHLPFQDLLEVVDRAARILKPGGIAIFETPDPRNLFVSSHNFYLDPTHRHPLPSELLAFAIEARGFSKPEIIPLAPYPDSYHLQESGCPAAGFINEHFFGPQDYGMIARKAPTSFHDGLQ